MKSFGKFFSILISISVVLAALLPGGTVFAAKDLGSINLLIYNKSGATANFDLVDAAGVHHSSTLPKGLTTMVLPEGWYGYFAGLVCGHRSGKFNMNVGKALYLTCGDSAGVDLMNNAGRSNHPLYCYGIYDYWGFTNWEYAYMGDWCQSTAAVVGEYIVYPVPDPAGTYGGAAWFFNSGKDACAPEFGRGYYYDDC